VSIPETTPAPSPHDVVVADIKKYGPELKAGAAETLGALWSSSLGELPADKRAEKIAENLATTWAQENYKDTEHVAPKLANGADQSPLRQALARNADRLAPGAVDKLTTQLAGQVVGQTPAQIAGSVERFLGSRAAHPHLAVRPAQPAEEARIQEIILRRFPGVGNELIASVQGDRSNHHKSEELIVSMVAATLGLPHSDPRRGGGPASIQHRPEPPKPLPVPVRNPDGTFTTPPPPEAPPRRSLVR
jgi:hypothetical protein